MADFDRILPCASSQSAPREIDRGWRLRVHREDGECAQLFEERVLPERVMRPDANRIFEKTSIWLTTDEVRWIRDQLNDLLPIMEKQDAKDQAALDARNSPAPGDERGGV